MFQLFTLPNNLNPGGTLHPGGENDGVHNPEPGGEREGDVEVVTSCHGNHCHYSTGNWVVMCTLGLELIEC